MKLSDLVESFPDKEFLIADGFNDAIIGYCMSTDRVIYSYVKTIELLIGEGLTEEDAIEHFYYNVIGSYVGDRTPIWNYDESF